MPSSCAAEVVAHSDQIVEQIILPLCLHICLLVRQLAADDMLAHVESSHWEIDESM